jgi:hypothetical protein
MTDLEKRAVTALHSVKMPEKNWHARRAKLLYELMEKSPCASLYSTSVGDLWFLVWTYRRQIADRQVVAEANAVVNGALNLEFT